MLKNYFKIAFRQIVKNRAFSIINIGGLSLGLSAALFIAVYVQFEFSYDRDLAHADNLCRLNLTSLKDGALIESSARTSPPFGSLFKGETSAVKDFSRVVVLGEAVAGNNEQFIREKDIFLVDENYFEFFDFSIQKGFADLMQEPLKVMISDETAQKIFKDADPIGKQLSINSTNFDGTVDFDVVGVFNSPPANRHLRPQILVSYATLYHFIGTQVDENVDWLNIYTYLKFQKGADVADVEGLLNASLQKHYGEKLKASNTDWHLGLQPVTDIHTSMAYVGEYEQGVDGKKLKYFVWIAAFVLLMVYLNSINITNASALTRSKEIGIRKVVGGSKTQLFFQFMLEALFLNFIAIALAIVIISSVSSLLIDFFQLTIPESTFLFSHYLLELTGLWIFGTLVSGLYPAAILTSFSPSRALTGSLKYKFKGAFAKPLTISQLIICLLILAGTITVYFQLDYMRKQKIGISLDNKIVVRSPMLFVEGSGHYQKVIHQKFTALEGIKNVAATNVGPGEEVFWRSDQFHREGVEPDGTMFFNFHVGERYLDLLNIKLFAGKSFNPSLEPNVEAIINKKALEALGFKNATSAIGEKIVQGDHVMEIVGVVDDFRQQGVNQPRSPTILNYSGGDLNFYIVDIEDGSQKKSLEKIKATFQTIFPASPYEYYFLDDFYDRQYKNEQQFTKFFSLAAIITIVIAIMGIIGVTTQLIIQKNKEVSIRKILGASVANIFLLISREYGIWLLTCYLVAIPLSYYLFSNWLNNFLVRITLGWWFFIVPALLVAIIFILSTIFQTIKTALVNPADILKNE